MRLMRGALLALTLALAGPAVAQDPMDEGPCKMDGSDCATGGGSGTGTGFECDAEVCLFQAAAGYSIEVNSDSTYLGDEAGNSIFGVTPAGALTYIKARLVGAAKEQRDINTLSSTGTILGTNVLCSTGSGAVVGTLDADAATDGRFVYVTRSGANACTVGVESGHTLDGVTDGTAALANGASRTFKQASSTAWVTVSSYPAALSGLTTGALHYASDSSTLAASNAYRPDANTLAVVNGTTAQKIRVFKTNDGSAGAVGTNYAYIDITSDANGAVWEWKKGGTGAGTFNSIKVPSGVYPAVWYVNDVQMGYLNPSGALVLTGGASFGGHVTGCASCSLGQSGTQWQDGWISRDLYANHLMGVGTAPTVAGSCGTSPSIAGKDSFFKITTGTGSPTSCTVTFGRAYSTAPVCVANAATTTTALLMTTTTTTAVVSSAALTAGEVLHVMCGGF